MDLKKLALAAAAGTTLLAAAPAFADPRDWDRGRDYGRDHGRHYGHVHGRYERQFRHDHYRAPVRHAYSRPPRVVERVVVVQQPAPVYYAPQPAQPGFSAQVPIGRNANINFDFRL